MRVAVFNTKVYDRQFLNAVHERHRHQHTSFEARPDHFAAAPAHGFPAICPFVSDHPGAHLLERLAAGRTKLIALRSAGTNTVDLVAG